MTVEISYFQTQATNGLPVAADPGRDGTTGEAASVTISSTAGYSAVSPDGYKVVSLIGTEAFRYEYGPATAAVANSNYVAAGERMWLASRAGWKFSLRTA
jgi:hypothetical protein